MDIKDYKFNVGDKVVTIDGVVGKITSICDCDHCTERGFFEPFWVDDDGRSRNIGNYEAKRGFREYHQIGEYYFHEFDRSVVLSDIAAYEKELKRLKKQLRTIELLETTCTHCKDGTYRRATRQFSDGTFVRRENFCPQCGRDLRNI